MRTVPICPLCDGEKIFMMEIAHVDETGDTRHCPKDFVVCCEDCGVLDKVSEIAFEIIRYFVMKSCSVLLGKAFSVGESMQLQEKEGGITIWQN